jgi:hypothetical protein
MAAKASANGIWKCLLLQLLVMGRAFVMGGWWVVFIEFGIAGLKAVSDFILLGFD